MPALERMLDQFDDVAAVIMEPTGATFGLVPLVEGFAARVRQATARKGVLLIFDEVITGFRVAAGGAQQLLGVTPDLATFAKIIAGGLPGGAVTGRADVMDTMTPRAEREWNLRHRVPHQGTFNANPLTAAAGLATLKLIEDGRAIADANQAAAQLRDRLNEVLKRQGWPWIVYGASSGFHVFLNPREREVAPADIAAGRVPADELKPLAGPAVHDFRCGLIVGGVDLFPWPGGCVSAVHGDAEIEATVRAFQTCLALALDKAAV
jgi:glutamate-1-semialdehyde 2,1-aminomutase